MGLTGRSASEYSPEATRVIVSTCLTVAQVIGDTIVDDAVIVGGVVPTLLYQHLQPNEALARHIGTADLDLALDVVIFDEQKYEAIADRLRNAGFKPAMSTSGNPVRQKWIREEGVEIDFLMPVFEGGAAPGRIQSLTEAFGAVVMPGLDLAFANRVTISLAGLDLEERSVECALPICRPDIFIALKALAMSRRDKPKDAYDIDYVLRRDSLGVAGLAAQLRPMLADETIVKAVACLRKHYASIDGRGPSDVAAFLGRKGDDELRGQALAYVADFLDALEDER